MDDDFQQRDEDPYSPRQLGGGLLGVGGWLFADLLLALSLIFLVSMSTFQPPVQGPPTPAPCVHIVEHVEDRENDFHVDAGPRGSLPTDDQLRQAFAPYRGHAAGIVLTYVTATRVGTGQTMARAVNQRLAALVPDVMTAQTIPKGLGNEVPSGAGQGSVDFEVYLLVTTCR
ncbi:MAG TPA: hypothetical protein VIC57_15575 [Candidatus Dormibacteraeota bacterium]